MYPLSVAILGLTDHMAADLVDALDRVAPELIIREPAVLPHDAEGDQRSSAEYLFPHHCDIVSGWHPIFHRYFGCVISFSVFFFFPSFRTDVLTVATLFSMFTWMLGTAEYEGLAK